MLQTDHLHWKDLLLEKSFSKDSQRFRNPQENTIFFPGMVVLVCFRKKKRKKKNVINGLLVVSQSPFANHHGFGVWRPSTLPKNILWPSNSQRLEWFTPRCVAVRFRWAFFRAGPNPKVFEAERCFWQPCFFQTGCQKQPSQKYHRKKYTNNNN